MNTPSEASERNFVIEWWPIDRPIPYARNARKIPEAAVDKVAASIKEFGFRQPIVCDAQDVIIIGHVRLRAAKKLGLTHVPVHVARDLTPAQVKALRLMDNRSHEEATWDYELLGPELADLQRLGFGINLTGFDEQELAGLLTETTEGLADPDEVPPVPEAPVSRLGDLWVLGSDGGRPPHRVLCGDATQAADTTRLMAGQNSPFLMVIDPPYGVDVDPTWREEVGLNPHTRQGGKVSNDDRVDWRAAYQLFPGDVAYVWHAGIHAAEVAVGLHSCDFQIRAQIIWKKQHFAISRGAYHWGHEPCWYAVRKGKFSHWRGDRTQSTVWEVANLNPFGGDKQAENEATGHGTQKPVELMRRPILNHTQAGEAVYDCFLGSGSSLIAAESTGRVCCGIDIDPKYIDVAVMRWQKFTGRQAVLDGHDGQAFDVVKESPAAVEA